MARADLLVTLVRAARSGDDVAFQRTVEALAAEERSNQHHVLAERLEDALRRNGGGPVHEVPSATGVQTLVPRRTLADLLLPKRVQEACEEVVEEQHRAELLRSHGLEPRHRLLLTGPPGNGKTSLAEAIAEALVVPMLRVRYEAVIGSYLGETANQLSQVFAAARSRRCVLFFDEFDAIAKERGDAHETGEIKRVVSTLLMQVDDMPSHVVIVAASNHPELLDRAAGRRFELRLDLPRPNAEARSAWFERFAGTLDERLKISSAVFSEATEGASFSALELLGLDVRRRVVLDRRVDATRALRERLKHWAAETADWRA